VRYEEPEQRHDDPSFGPSVAHAQVRSPLEDLMLPDSEPRSRPLPYERAALASPISARSFDRRVSPAIHGEIAAVAHRRDSRELVAVVALRSASRVPADQRGYVRFFLSRDGGASYSDVGLVSFPLPSEAHTESVRVVTLPITFEPGPATNERASLVRVRAVLALDGLPPTARGTIPRRGQSFDAEALFEPRPPSVDELLRLAGIPLAPGLLETLGVVGIRKSDPLVPPVVELARRYAPFGAWHRALLPTFELSRAARQPRILASVIGRLPRELGIDYAAAIRRLDDATDRSAYEDLASVGLDSDARQLVAVLRTKKRAGYLGGLGEEGGLEHVAFWLDRGDGVLRYEGTASARVHDVGASREGLLCHAVGLPVDLSLRRGPGRMRVRAVLSFRELPSASDPHALPRFGHHREALL
jgi:hypothetical protein